ncbi:MAG: hypothetical protein V2I36_12455 [Desulfopila sp.]|jgi:hypothetical protein|nr:hypothetical protein [Desulfopila sp.]
MTKSILEKNVDTYEEAHLFVAAVRVLAHQKGVAPALTDVCSLVGISSEAGHALCRSLEKRKIIETLSDPYSIRLCISDHLALENIPRGREEKDSLAKELEKFKEEKKKKEKSAAAIQAEIEQKKRDMLADIEAKFKKEMEKYKK